MSSYAIIVDSCDKYADCWIPMSECIKKFWFEAEKSGNLKKVYLITDGGGKKPVKVELEDTVFSDNIISIPASAWGELLKKALNTVAEEYVFLVLDDQWPGEYVNTKLIEKAFRYMESNPDVGVIYAEESKDKKSRNSEVYIEIPFGHAYRMSLAPALWKKDFLNKILVESDSAWNFERLGSYREYTKENKVLRMVKSAYTRCAPPGAIEKGFWLPSIPAFCEKNNICVDFSGRKIEDKKDIIVSKVKSFLFNLSPEFVVKMQNWSYHSRQIRNKE